VHDSSESTKLEVPAGISVEAVCNI